MIKVRFNLSTGKNFMKWQVIYPDGEVEYYDPELEQLNMYVCTLRNQKKIAIKIFEGGDKRVCAWVDCEALDVRVKGSIPIDKLDKLSYNPRVLTNWDLRGVNMDSEKLDFIVSSDRNLFTQ